MKTLEHILEKLKSHPDVDAVFLTGSYGENLKKYSDIDLIVILKENTHTLKSLYVWIDDRFADVFFFDHSDLDRMQSSVNLQGNSMDAIFVNWLEKGVMQFDSSGKLTTFKKAIPDLKETFLISDIDKQRVWVKINYNFIANSRYFNSEDSLYQEALEIRLLYSTAQVFTDYFVLRDIPWRGEKQALIYLKQHDTKFLESFFEYAQASGLQEKFEKYSELVKNALTPEYDFWTKDQIIPESKDSNETQGELIKYWNKLIA